MKLAPDRTHLQTISSYGDGWLVVSTYAAHDTTTAQNQQRFTTSILLSSHGDLQDFGATDFDSITPSHFEVLAALDVELVIFGSGQRQHFAKPVWLKPLIQKGIGVESMSTAAACRTYNILATEGRKVAAALLLK